MSDDKQPLQRIASTLLWSRGLNAKAPQQRAPFLLIRSTKCIDCTAWAKAYEASSLELMSAQIAEDAATAEVNSDGRCSTCAAEHDGFRSYIEAHGRDDEARDPSNYTPEPMMEQFLTLRGALKNGG